MGDGINKRIEMNNNMFDMLWKGEEIFHHFYVWLQNENGMASCKRCETTKIPSVKMKKKKKCKSRTEAQQLLWVH